MIENETKAKSKKIKKILKERLNIDCLRMLCDLSDDEENEDSASKRQQLLDNQGNNDSYQVLLKEVKRDFEI